jgi:hypothetical protein
MGHKEDKRTSGWGYNRASLYLEEDSKTWLFVLRDLDLRMTALERTSNNCKRQTQPLVREDVT